MTDATSPRRCLPMAALAVVVPPAESPVLAGIEPAALRYIAGSPGVPAAGIWSLGRHFCQILRAYYRAVGGAIARLR